MSVMVERLNTIGKGMVVDFLISQGIKPENLDDYEFDVSVEHKHELTICATGTVMVWEEEAQNEEFNFDDVEWQETDVVRDETLKECRMIDANTGEPYNERTFLENRLHKIIPDIEHYNESDIDLSKIGLKCYHYTLPANQSKLTKFGFIITESEGESR